MNELRKLQKAEAIKRMKRLNIMPQAIKEFDKEDKINRSENGGLLYWLNEKEQELVELFEDLSSGVVYHVIKNFTVDGLMYSLLFVSQYAEEWPQDIIDISEGLAFVYVVNVDAPDCSEFGLIGICPMTGGVERVS